MPRHVLIFGGTFDPPHPAHMALPVHVAERVGADVIVFVPTARNPHKDGPSAASSADRVAMLTRALAAVPPPIPAEVSTIEIDRGGRSWFVETMEAMAAAEPDARFTFLIGADNALGFHRWEQWERILELATPAVVLRPPWNEAGLRAALKDADAAEDVDVWMSRVVPAPLVEMSATDVRERLAGGAAPEDLLAPAVAAYVRERGLYGLPAAPDVAPAAAPPPRFDPATLDPSRAPIAPPPTPNHLVCPRCRHRIDMGDVSPDETPCPACRFVISIVPASRVRLLSPWLWTIAAPSIAAGVALGAVTALLGSGDIISEPFQLAMLLMLASAPLLSLIGWFSVRADLLQSSARTRLIVPVLSWVLGPLLLVPLVGHVVGVLFPMLTASLLARQPWEERMASCGACGYDISRSSNVCSECAAASHPAVASDALPQASWTIAIVATLTACMAAGVAPGLVRRSDAPDIQLDAGIDTKILLVLGGIFHVLILMILRPVWVRWPAPVRWTWATLSGLAIVVAASPP